MWSGKVLQSHGLRMLTCLKGRSERTRMLAREAQIDDVPTYEDLVAETEMVLSILVPESALDTARLVAGALRNAQQPTTFRALLRSIALWEAPRWLRKRLKPAIAIAHWPKSSQN
jgi:hypothetical protein